jgi:hypothetical protein
MLTLLCCTGTWATGELNGLFTINASGDKVQFSQGNLQATYDGSAWSWAFAENQWDYIGGRTNSGSEPQTGNNYINGNGTTYSSDHIDHTYARVDKPGQPGYLTDKGTAGINTVIADDNSNKPYYSLDGRKLSGTPTSKGVYIRNGRKVLVKYY